MYLKRIRKNQSYLRNIYIFFLWNCLPKMQQKPTVELKVVRECNKKKQKEKKSKNWDKNYTGLRFCCFLVCLDAVCWGWILLSVKSGFYCWLLVFNFPSKKGPPAPRFSLKPWNNPFLSQLLVRQYLQQKCQRSLKLMRLQTINDWDESAT